MVLCGGMIAKESAGREFARGGPSAVVVRGRGFRNRFPPARVLLIGLYLFQESSLRIRRPARRADRRDPHGRGRSAGYARGYPVVLAGRLTSTAAQCCCSACC